jgi:hypothetical protein
MKKCSYWRKQIPEALYEELDTSSRSELELHLNTCGRCAGLYRAMAETVKQMDIRPAPDREAEFWEAYWDGLERRMARVTSGRNEKEAKETTGTNESAFKPGRALGLPRWAYYALGATLLLVSGIFIGRTFFRQAIELAQSTDEVPLKSAPNVQSKVATTVAESPLAARASRYLKRSRVLLLALVNFDPEAEGTFGLNLPLQKKTSEELIQEAAVLKKELRSSDRRLERLVSDLEMILLQIANLKSGTDVAAVEIIKSGVQNKDILFKINLNEVRRSAENDGIEIVPKGSSPDHKGPNVKTIL